MHARLAAAAMLGCAALLQACPAAAAGPAWQPPPRSAVEFSVMIPRADASPSPLMAPGVSPSPNPRPVPQSPAAFLAIVIVVAVLGAGTAAVLRSRWR